MRILVTCFFLLNSPFLFGSFETVNKTAIEEAEISSRLHRFYHYPNDASVMSQEIPKFNIERKQFEKPQTNLKPNPKIQDPLRRNAEPKAKPAFLKYRCEKFFASKFPELECNKPLSWSRTEFEGNDKPEDLVASWIEPQNFESELGKLPIKGEVKSPYWSGDYWSMRRGLTSYRYSEGHAFGSYREAVESYAQPLQWLNSLQELNTEALSKRVLGWSPSEKYDLSVGDTSFQLTNEQKDEGKYHSNADGDVENWFGICHGWAAASIFVPPPAKKVEARGPSGITVTWYPDDIRAMATLAWANGSFKSNFIGGRCNSKETERYPNGRVKQQECFDNNPSTFHRAIANLIGLSGVPFVMDSAYDYQVWNQPIISYSFEYFNPLKPTDRSSNWENVAVNYDKSFKEKDRFQNPKTRGRRISDGKYDDSDIKKMVGVIASVSYLAEVGPIHGETPRGPSLYRVTYTYDLELEEKEGKYYPFGGEWHENAHPDFLWVPKKSAVANQYYDAYTPEVSLEHEPNGQLSNVARKASRTGYPLCKLLRELVNKSSVTGRYECPN